MKTKLSFSLFILAVLLIFSSCKKDHEIEDKQGQFSFSINPKIITKSNSEYSLENVTQVFITIQYKGEVLENFNNKGISVNNWGGGTYTTEPILLEAGSDYQLTRFELQNANNKIIFASPFENSDLADQVENPLPIDFDIEKDKTTEINVEVLSTEEKTPASFGFASFNIIDKTQNVPENMVRFNGKYLTNNKTSSLKTESANKIVVVYTELFTEENFLDGHEYTEISINEDGSFVFDIEKGRKFMAFVVSSEDNFKVKGVIGIGTGESEYWEDINTEYLNGLVGLGTISSSSQAGVLASEKLLSEISLEEGNTSLIQKLSRMDDHIRTYANYVNSNFINLATPGFSFYAPLQFNSWIDYNNTTYSGYQLYVFGEGLKTGNVLVPPTDITANSVTYNASNPISTESDIDEAGFSFAEFFKGETSVDLPQGQIPSGEWKLMKDNELISTFLLSSVQPIDNDNRINVPIPAIKINTENELVKTIEIKWFLNNAGTFEEVDIELLKDRLSNLHLEVTDFRDNDNRRDETINNLGVASSIISLSQEWSTNINSQSNYVESFVIGYNMDCVYYTCKIRAN